MARMAKNDQTTDILFGKAETSGEIGKQLGRELGVDAVPAFCLFRNGKLYGSPLSISKLPSPKMDRALELLESGKPWDTSVLDEDS